MLDRYEIAFDMTISDFQEKCRDGMDKMFALRQWGPPHKFEVRVRTKVMAREWKFTIVRPDGVTEVHTVSSANNTSTFFHELFDGAYVRWTDKLAKRKPR